MVGRVVGKLVDMVGNTDQGGQGGYWKASWLVEALPICLPRCSTVEQRGDGASSAPLGSKQDKGGHR